MNLQGCTARKANKSARSVISPEQATVNSGVEHRLSDLTNQADALTEQTAQAASAAMSVISSDQRAFNPSGVPAFIQTDPTAGNASAIGSDNVTDAQCRRLLNEQQIHHGEQMDALSLQNQQLMAKIQNLEMNNSAVATTTDSSHSGFCPHQNQPGDKSSVKKDSQGRRWYQVKFCCSKHGFNTCHSNETCNNKHMNEGHPWVPGATPADTKGGSNALSDKVNHWFEPRSKQCLPLPPN